MAKDSYWFKHDANARDDLKLVKLRRIYTHWSDGIYWNVIEVLRGQNKYKYSLNESDLQLLCEDLIRCPDFDKFKNWLNDGFDLLPESLFKKDEKYFWSESLILRMKKWEISKKNGEKGGRPIKDENDTEEPKAKPDVKPKAKPDDKPDTKPLDKSIEDKIRNKYKEFLNDGDLINLFFDFLELRKKKKVPATDRAIDLLIKKLEKLSNGDPVIKKQIIEKSITSGWQDFYELKIGQIQKEIRLEPKNRNLEDYEFNKS